MDRSLDLPLPGPVGWRHVRRDAGLKFPHERGSGWVPGALDALMGIAKTDEGER